MGTGNLIKGILVFAVVIIVGLGIWFFVINTGNTSKTSPPETDLSEVKFYTLQDVSKHNTKEDCWMVIDERVYDVTNFIALGKHGPAILEGCGKDATKLFNSRTRDDGTKIGSGTPHSETARNLTRNYYIGNLKE
ncbi:MAG: cytochrome b5-like heme/steroid binding domain-containing protein [Candidatus Altiarchaeota archaeon]